MAEQAFYLPDLGEGLTQGRVVTWHTKVGELITKHAPLVDIETQKSIVEVPSPFTGRILTLHANVGVITEVGAPLATFEVTQETHSTVVGRLHHGTSVLPATTQLTQPSPPHSHADPCLPLHLQSMAQTVTQAARQSVAVTLHDDLPCQHPHRITVRLLQAMHHAAKAYPQCNAHYRAFSAYHLCESIQIGIAMHQDQSLRLPSMLIQANDDLDILQQRLEAIKRNPLAHHQQTPTMILSNFGRFYGRYGTPMLAPPSVLTLGVGRLFERDGTWHCPLSISIDHRVLSGVDAGRFMQCVAEALLESAACTTPQGVH